MATKIKRGLEGLNERQKVRVAFWAFGGKSPEQIAVLMAKGAPAGFGVRLEVEALKAELSEWKQKWFRGFLKGEEARERELRRCKDPAKRLEGRALSKQVLPMLVAGGREASDYDVLCRVIKLVEGREARDGLEDLEQGRDALKQEKVEFKAWRKKWDGGNTLREKPGLDAAGKIAAMQRVAFGG